MLHHINALYNSQHSLLQAHDLMLGLSGASEMLIVDLAPLDVRWSKLLWTHAHHLLVFTVVPQTLARLQAGHSYGEHQMSSSHSSLISFRCFVKMQQPLPSTIWSHRETHSVAEISFQYSPWYDQIPLSLFQQSKIHDKFCATLQSITAAPDSVLIP